MKKCQLRKIEASQVVRNLWVLMLAHQDTTSQWPHSVVPTTPVPQKFLLLLLPVQNHVMRQDGSRRICKFWMYWASFRPVILHDLRLSSTIQWTHRPYERSAGHSLLSPPYYSQPVQLWSQKSNRIGGKRSVLDQRTLPEMFMQLLQNKDCVGVDTDSTIILLRILRLV